MLDMELSSSITVRFSTRHCDSCRTNLDAALAVYRQAGTDHQIAARGHDLEYRGTTEVLEVASPPAADGIAPVETRRVDARTGLWCQEEP